MPVCPLEFPMPSSNLNTMTAEAAVFPASPLRISFSLQVCEICRNNLGSSMSVSSLFCCSQQPPELAQTGMRSQELPVLPDTSTWWLLPSLCLKRSLVLFLERGVGDTVTDLSASMEAENSLVVSFLLPSCDQYLSTCITPGSE